MSEWHDWRAKGVGASEVAAVCGINPYATAFDVWAVKTGKVPGRDQTEKMRFGLLLEPVIAKEFTYQTGLFVLGEQTWCEHPEHPHHRATVDGFVAESDFSPMSEVLGVYEAKTGQPVWHDLPDTYTVQVQWQLHVTGMPRAWVAYLRAGYDFSIHTVERDDELIARLCERVDRFWLDHVQTDTPPHPTARSDVAAVFPNATADAVELGDAALWWDRAVALRRQIKHLDEQLDLAKNNLRLAVGDHAAGTVNGSVAVTWKEQTRKGIDAEALQRDHPDIAEKYAKTTTTRTLLVKERP